MCDHEKEDVCGLCNPGDQIEDSVESEARALELEISGADDWPEDEEEVSLDGLIVDTRDWLYANPDDIFSMNAERAECNVPLSALVSVIETAQINSRTSARNWRKN